MAEQKDLVKRHQQDQREISGLKQELQRKDRAVVWANDNPDSESLFRTDKSHSDHPNRTFRTREETCLWVAAFLEWTNHQHRHSGTQVVTPHPHHSGQAVAICTRRDQL
jgi:hypothetical protein